MGAATSKATAPRMSDEAVKAKTGKSWIQWFTILDKANGQNMNHQEMVKLLNSKHDVGPWWQQMVAVTYEQARGLREKHEKPSGFEISVSRTVNTPVEKLYKHVANEKTRNAWLEEEGLAVRKTTPNKSIRVTWKDGKSIVVFAFQPKGTGKSQIVVQQSKLPDAKVSAKMKSYWANALDRLKASLEK